MGGRGCAAEAPSSGGRSRRAAAAAKVYLQLCVRMGGASSAGALPAVSRYRGFSHRSRPDGWVSLSAGGRCSRAGTRWGQEGGSSGGAWGGGHLSAPRCRAQSTGAVGLAGAADGAMLGRDRQRGRGHPRSLAVSQELPWGWTAARVWDASQLRSIGRHLPRDRCRGDTATGTRPRGVSPGPPPAVGQPRGHLVGLVRVL